MVLGTELPFASKLARGLFKVIAQAVSTSQIGGVSPRGAGRGICADLCVAEVGGKFVRHMHFC